MFHFISPVAFHQFCIGFSDSDRSYTTALSGKYISHTKSSGTHMSKTSKIYLEFCFFCMGMQRKDLKNKIYLVPYFDFWILSKEYFLKCIELSWLHNIV